VAVVDSEKLGVVANWRICNASELNVLITDTKAADSAIEPFQKLGIEIMRV
jgi:DeoR family transcriptional regulator of aga operon